MTIFNDELKPDNDFEERQSSLNRIGTYTLTATFTEKQLRRFINKLVDNSDIYETKEKMMRRAFASLTEVGEKKIYWTLEEN